MTLSAPVQSPFPIANPGRVTIVNMDGESWSFFLDGQYWGGTRHEYFTETAFSPSALKDWAKDAGVAVSDLRFDVYPDFFEKAEAVIADYDSNDCMDDFGATRDVLTQTGLAPQGQNLTLEQLEQQY